VKGIFTTLVLVTLLPSLAKAEYLSVANPGFEAQTVANGTYIDNGAPTGWQTYDPNGIIGHNYSSLGVLNPAGTALYPGGAPQGRNVALVFLWPYAPHLADAGKPAGIQQTLAANLQANTQYTLTLQIGNIAVEPPPPYVAFDLNGFPGYRIELLAGGVLLAADNDTLDPAEGTFALSTTTFVTGAAHPQLGQALTIRLINLNTPNSGIEVNFDDVRLEAVPVPEPSTIAMGFAAVLAVGLHLRRRRP
jgi:hypothetical protein